MKQSVIKKLDTIIDKLITVSGQIEGNQLQTALREIANVRTRIESNQLKIKNR